MLCTPQLDIPHWLDWAHGQWSIGLNNICQFEQVWYCDAVINMANYGYVWWRRFVIFPGMIFVIWICNFLDLSFFINLCQTWTIYGLWIKIGYQHVADKIPQRSVLIISPYYVTLHMSANFLCFGGLAFPWVLCPT